MAESENDVPPFKLVVATYRCDFCGDADVEATGTVFTSDPLQYEHRCPACNGRHVLRRSYPYRREVLVEAAEAMSEHPFQLSAEEPVEREDGRFYIPLVITPGGAIPILRVSTDCFQGDVNLAIEFACDLAARWNRGPC